jgi:hypothetical protein
MATIIERERERDRPVVERDDSGAGVAAILVVLAVLVIGGIILARYYNVSAPATQNPGTNINVDVPLPSTGSGGTQSTPSGGAAPTQSGGAGGMQSGTGY